MSIDLERSAFGRIARKPAPMLVPDRLTVKMTVKVCGAAASAITNQQLRRLVDDRVGVAFEIYRGLSRSIEKWTQRVDSIGKCLSRSIEIYRWDALQSDGKSDGKNVALSSRRKFTVRSIFGLTVNLECEVQHPCGFPGDRRIGRADGKFPRSQAIGRTGASRFVAPRRAREWKGRGRDNLPVVDLWNYIINGSLADRRSTRGTATTADLGDLSFPSRTEPTATGYSMPAMRWTAAARASEVAGSTRPVAAIRSIRKLPRQ